MAGPEQWTPRDLVFLLVEGLGLGFRVWGLGFRV